LQTKYEAEAIENTKL
jgi:hypothetical protein